MTQYTNIESALKNDR